MRLSMETLISHYPDLAVLEDVLIKAAELLIERYRGGYKLLLCGNGGSAADCEHIAGELLKGFLNTRPLTETDRQALSATAGVELGGRLGRTLQYGLPAIPLPSLSAASSAFANDVDSAGVFAQLVTALGKPGDLLLALSTSGNSQNVLAAVATAQARGLGVIAMTGQKGGRLKEFADLLIAVPAEQTYRVQELHLPVYHWLCAEVEAAFYGEQP